MQAQKSSLPVVRCLSSVSGFRNSDSQVALIVYRHNIFRSSVALYGLKWCNVDQQSLVRGIIKVAWVGNPTVSKQRLFTSNYSAPVGVQSIVINLSVCVCVCLSASISLEPVDRSSQNFVCRSPAAMAQSSSSGVILCYVLQILWITSRLAIVGRMSVHRLRCEV